MSILKKTIANTSPWITLVVLLAVGIRLVLPYTILDYVNKRINKIPEYEGKIDDLTLSLFRGAYTLHGTKLLKRTGKTQVPFFSSREIDFSVEWSALLKGKVVGEINFTEPKINFVSSPNPAAEQTAISNEWLAALKDLFPLRINRFEIDNGQVRYRNFESTPPVNIGLTQVQVVGKNFSNTRHPVNEGVATISAKAVAQNSGNVSLALDMEPAKAKPTFKVVASLEKLPIAELNDFFKAYAGFDAEAGTINVYSEASAKEGAVDGYVKPMISNLSVFQISKDITNPIDFIWEGLVGLAVELFENQRKDLLATKIDFKGNFDNPKPELFQSFLTLLRNAYIHSLKTGTDGSFSLNDQIEQKPAEKHEEKTLLKGN